MSLFRMNEVPDNFALIIGAMKSGTTSLFDILSQHPQVCPSKTKEPDYFIADRDGKSRNEYLGLWGWNEKQHKIALESSVAYSKSPFIPNVPERICKSKLGSYKFIYMLRDPIKRIESQVRHGVFAGWGKSLSEGISDDLIDFTRYSMQINNYLRYFSRDHIYVLTLEEFKADPHAVLRRICVFLELDAEFSFHNVAKPRNPGEFFSGSPAIARMTQNSFGQFVSQKLLPRKLKNWLRDFITKINIKRNDHAELGRWQLNDDERKYVYNVLEQDLVRLREDFDIDIQKYWNITPATFSKD